MKKMLLVLVVYMVSLPGVRSGIILGTNTGALIGNDLTDRTEVNGATLQGMVTASGMIVGSEGAGGEHAHRVFDNGVNRPPPNAAHDQDRTKVCCGGLGGHITFQFANGPQVVRTYTVASANDAATRDPVEWQILGSNDGVNFTLLDHVQNNTWTARHQVQIFNQFSEGANNTAYEYIRYAPLGSVSNVQHQISELEYFSFDSTRQGTVLAGGLLGGDLTDPENDGDPEADVNYDAIFASDNSPGFGGGENAFNIFDNRLGGGNNKWCCDDPSPGNALNGNGHQVDATLKDGKSAFLTHFTIASSNDSPGRDPRIWGIYGSKDGVTFDPIFFHARESGSVFSARDQVVQFTAGVDFEVQTEAYSTFRLSFVDSVDGGNSALGEIEYFGAVIPEPSGMVLLGLGLIMVRLHRKFC